MPKRADIKKVLVIGSGPIIIGQAAEFDYAGTQACRSLKEEGIEVVLVNSNPATIMTDKDIADHVYIEPLTEQTITDIIIKEKPDSILPTLGGQVGLNLAMQLAEDGVFRRYGVKMLGTASESIRKAEDRQGFKDAMEEIGQPCVESLVVESVQDALDFAAKIGYPVIVRPAYTLGGTGGGIANTVDELREIAEGGIRSSRVGQILIERCIAGWKEIEFEVIRDGAGNVITICSMENVDPVGVHTGDSIVVAPAQTLAVKEYTMLSWSAIQIISALGIEGGCNVQFALNPYSFEYAVIEVNPRVSRSSALASKATGYPIAKVAAKIALGYNMDEIRNSVTGTTYACFEPAVDYCVVKIPKWPFDKFVTASRKLGTQMKATGEVMAISSNFESAMMKAVRSLELHLNSLILPELQQYTDEEIRQELYKIDDHRVFVVAEALRRGMTADEIHDITTMDVWFIDRFHNIVKMENSLKAGELTTALLKQAKIMGFGDDLIAALCGMTEADVRAMRKANGINAVFKMVDTCAAEYEAGTPYYYSSFDEENEAVLKETGEKRILVLGSGPIRIGQGVEFDYCSVHSVWAFKRLGCETIIVNNNPETVSTDFDVADRLYFEPLTAEDVRNVVENEKPYGAVVQFGGQTAIKLTQALTDMGVPILGTSAEGVDEAEDREKFDVILNQTGISKADAGTVFTADEALEVANRIGYPVLVRPSYVLGGQGMEIAYDDGDIKKYMGIINRFAQEHPILVDKYLMGREVEVDAVCDGEDILIPGIMEHLERAGVHSGDSISVYPPLHIEDKHIEMITEYSRRLATALHVVGLVNIQFVIFNDRVYVIEVNPRSSRTIPYISKVTGVPIIDMATRVIMGEKLKDMKWGVGLYPAADHYAVKIPVFSFEKLGDVDTSLGPEMKSTGEVLGIADTFPKALRKACIAANMKLPQQGSRIVMTVKDADKGEIIGIGRDLEEIGATILATEGTYNVLEKAGIDAELINHIDGPNPNIIDIIHSGQADMVINTSKKGGIVTSEGFHIRRCASERGIACVTAIDTARALLAARAARIGELKPLDIATI